MQLPRLLSVALLLASASVVHAVPVLTSGSWDGPNKNLNHYFNAWGVGLDVNTDQLVNDILWGDKLSGGSTGVMLLEVAGHAGTNTFGIYQQSGTSISRTQLFAGSAAQGASTLIPIPIGDFGFYLGYQTQYGMKYFYSNPYLNPDKADQMVAYQGPSVPTSITTGIGTVPWDMNTYIIAWEDLVYKSSDKDFNDMVIILRTPRQEVPDAGSTAVLTLLALAGLAAARRRA
jgi:hypothetical protein